MLPVTLRIVDCDFATLVNALRYQYHPLYPQPDKSLKLGVGGAGVIDEPGVVAL